MSVRLNARKPTQLEVLARAKELAIYSVHICSNEKTFPKRYRWTMSNQIIETALSIAINISEANKTPLTEEFITERRKHQQRAMNDISALYTLVDMAYVLFRLENMEYWTSLIDGTETKLIGWIKSDAKRMKN